MFKRILLNLLIIGFLSLQAFSQCNFSVNAGPDLKVCNAGDMITINGKVTGNPTEIFWTPATGLSNSKSPVTKATVTAPIEYILTARGLSTINIITNGNFEAGKTGFSTDYVVGTVPCYGAGYLDCEGTYDVINNPQLGHSAWAACGDHTSGSGLMMVINGAAAFQNVWCQNVPVLPDMDYVFTAWITSVHPSSPAVLQFSINGTNIGPNFTSSGVTCLWEKYEVIWNSGSNTNADICILNENTATGGNDFAIDDIGFRKMCEVKDTMKIEIEEIIVEIEEPQIATCDQPTQKLNAKASSNGPGWTYQWTTADGKIVSGANTPEPVIRGPGTYVLTVCSPLPNCCLTKSIEVTGRITPPDLLIILNDTLGCNNQSVSITTRSKIFPLDYYWNGPNGFSSGDPVIAVTEAGKYVLTIVDEYNCKTTDSVTVLEHLDNPKISITSNPINCKIDTARLIGSSTIPGSKFEWTGPNNSSSKSDTFNVVDSGVYVLKVTTPSGCVKFDSVRIKKDQLVPQLSYFADTLTCTNDSATILVNSNLKLINTNWQSQHAFRQLDTLYIKAHEAGRYSLQVEAINGCVNTLNIDLTADTVAPILNPIADTLTCLKLNANLISNSSDPFADIHWTGPNGFDSGLDSIQTNQGGNYSVIGTSKNGCADTAQVFIAMDTIHPKLQSSDDTLTCIKTSVNLQLSDVHSSAYSWTGPNNFTSTQKSPSINSPGVYVVTATLPNGCSSSQQIYISEDVAKPVIQVNNDTLTCKKDSLALNASKDQSGAFVEWKGPNGFASNQINPFITEPGNYQLVVTNPNGCKDSASLIIYQDIGKPDLNARNDTLNCLIRIVDLVANSSRDSLTYLWTGPNGFTANTKTISVNQGGTYTIRISTPEDCFSVLNVDVFEDTLKPDLQLIPDTLNCLKTQTNLLFNSNTQLISQDWSGPGNFNSTQKNPLITQGGIYTLKVTATNQCTELKTINIVQDTTRPIISAIPDSINCNKREVDLTANVTPSKLIGEWTLPNQQKIKANSIKTKAGGDFSFDVIGDNYCINSILINIPVDTIKPDLSVEDDTIDCRNNTAIIFATSQTLKLKYEWNGPFSYFSDLRGNVVDKPGQYYVKITAPNGCIQTDSAIVKIDTVKPKLDITKDSIYCGHPEASLFASTDIVNPLIAWIFQLPQLPQLGPSLKVKTGGQVDVEVLNNLNGCRKRVKVNIPQDSLIITDVIIDPVHPICGAKNGSAQIVKVIGGHNTIQYSIDQKKTFSPNTNFNPLPAGLYTLFVKDDKNCEFQKDFEIVELPFIETDLVPEITLTLGDSTRMDLDIIPDRLLVKSIHWNPSTFLSCSDCEDPIVKPLVTTDYEVTVIDTNGCQSVKRVRVVVETPKVWVPNVFTPNGDNVNDEVWVFGSKAEVTRINIFQIFDRWGNRVFENTNFQPNDSSKGWDGRYQDQKCNPGVYVYWAEVELTDGQKWIIKGDITLIR